MNEPSQHRVATLVKYHSAHADERTGLPDRVSVLSYRDVALTGSQLFMRSVLPDTALPPPHLALEMIETRLLP